MKVKVFITGATGTVGKKIVSLFLKETDSDLYLLLRDKNSLSNKNSLIKNAFDLQVNNKLTKRVFLVSGDITKVNLGLSKKSYSDLTNKITHVLHCAASTRFDLPLAEARKINVTGTKNIIKFSESCSSLAQAGFLSTVFVSGKMTGRIPESEISHKSGFVNTYEQSKYESEKLIFKSKKIPFTIYRLATVIGGHETGKVDKFSAIHLAMRIMYLGLASMLPGTPDYKVNLISDSYSAETIFKLFWNNFTPYTVYNITDEKKAFSLSQIIEKTFKEFKKANQNWARAQYPKPSIVTKNTFDLFVESVEKSGNVFLKKSVLPLTFFASQLAYPKTFENKNVTKTLTDYEKKLPDINIYYGKVIKYCLSTNWGKHD